VLTLTRQPWSTTLTKPPPGSPRPAWQAYAQALAKKGAEGLTIGELFDHGMKLKEVEQYQPGYLSPGTRVTLRDGRRATVTNFVPFDGWNLGVRVDGLPNEGLITMRKDITV